MSDVAANPVRYETALKTAEPEGRAPQVRHAVSYLDSETERLALVVGKLEDRLGAYLVSLPPSESTRLAEPSDAVPMASDIARATSRLADQIDRLISITDRFEG